MRRFIPHVLAGVLALTVAPAAATALAVGPRPTPSAAAASTGLDRSQAVSERASTPTTGLFYNVPGEGAAGAHVRDLYIDRFESTPAGATVRIATWNVTDTDVVAAIKDAFEGDDDGVADGADIRVLVGKDKCAEVNDILSFLDAQDTPGSWVRCVGNGYGMHQKSVMFSSTGGVGNVTLVGSSNMAFGNWQDQWNDMYQFAGYNDIYQVYVDRFDKIARNLDTPTNVTYETHTIGSHRVNFLPIDNEATREHDPVWERLDNIPATSGGQAAEIDIAVYSMDVDRGKWLVSKLVSMRAAGAKIRFVAGPYVNEGLKADLIDGGVRVVNGYVKGCSSPDEQTHCNFVHLKMMTAHYYDGGPEVFRSYTGSSNWSMDGLVRNFEVLQRIAGRPAYDAYHELFTKVWTGFRDHWAT